PFATSETVPSPPQAMISFAPFRAASPASAAASPRCFVKITRNEPNCERKSLASCGHASPVLPPADAGLTITTDISISNFRLPIADLLRFQFGNWQLGFGLVLQVPQSFPSPRQQSLCASAIDRASQDAQTDPGPARSESESHPRDSSFAPPVAANCYTTQR